eukprot:scaffold95668_cov20-Prasinocladus_malaysianus.AAC.1
MQNGYFDCPEGGRRPPEGGALPIHSRVARVASRYSHPKQEATTRTLTSTERFGLFTASRLSGHRRRRQRWASRETLLSNSQIAKKTHNKAADSSLFLPIATMLTSSDYGGSSLMSCNLMRQCRCACPAALAGGLVPGEGDGTRNARTGTRTRMRSLSEISYEYTDPRP